MSRYFFSVCKDSHPPDTSGADLEDAKSARREATLRMAEEMKANPDVIWNDEEWRIDVTDETGLILFSVYSSAIKSAAGGRH